MRGWGSGNFSNPELVYSICVGQNPEKFGIPNNPLIKVPLPPCHSGGWATPIHRAPGRKSCPPPALSHTHTRTRAHTHCCQALHIAQASPDLEGNSASHPAPKDEKGRGSACFFFDSHPPPIVWAWPGICLHPEPDNLHLRNPVLV